MIARAFFLQNALAVGGDSRDRRLTDRGVSAVGYFNYLAASTLARNPLTRSNFC